MANRQGSAGSGDLERLTRRLQITAYVSGGLVVLIAMGLLTPAVGDIVLYLFWPGLLVLTVSSVGAVVGRLLLAARRDELPVPEGQSQDWYQ
jgi:hypothetical protein